MKILLCLFLIFLFPSDIAQAATKNTCKSKKLDTGEVEGKFIELYCDVYCRVIIETASGERDSIFIGDDEAEKWFGSASGQRIAVKYVLYQFWNEESNECDRKDIAMSGSIVSSTTSTPSSTSSTAQTSAGKPAEPTDSAKSSGTVRPSGKTYTNSIGMEFVLIPAGSYIRPLEEPVKNEFGEILYDKQKITVSRPFYLGKYEVTQEQWVKVMGDNPSRFKGRTNPVESVSWNKVQEFTKRLNAKEGTNKYRLPTEMEWELAAKGGTDRYYYFFMKDSEVVELDEKAKKFNAAAFAAALRDDKHEAQRLMAKCKDIAEELSRTLDRYAWFSYNSESKTHPVGQKRANPFGLYDVYGNVWEWVQDWSAKLPTDREITDYKGPENGSYRVDRGGGWRDNAEDCRSASRGSYGPGGRGVNSGFRLALSPE
jgi:formylglycine-generating enzyme required for sulfatase activity